MPKQFLTCKFKLHNPSKHKRNVLDFALREYTLGYQGLLDYAREHLDKLTENGKYAYERKKKDGTVETVEKYTGKSVAKLLPYPSQLNVRLHSSAKDSLIQDVAGGLASYLALSETDERTNFPISRDPSPDAIQNADEMFSLVGGDPDDFEYHQALVLKRSRGSVMPLYFARADGASQDKEGGAKNRNFSLLFNIKTRQFLAVLYLLPLGHELSKSIQAIRGDLIRLDTGEVFTSNSKAAILVPLQLGSNDWQWYKFLEPAMNGPASIQSAYLVRNDETGEYFLHVSFALECPECFTAETYLGIDRGVFYSMAYGIVGKQGEILLMGHRNDGFRSERIQASKRIQAKQRDGCKVTAKDWRGKSLNNILHAVINEIIQLALEHRSMVILEDLNIQVRGKFYQSAWKKMHKLLEYKCKLAGVPLWKGGIWAAYSSQICIYCGGRNKGRKRDGSPFTCPYCHAIYHSDEGAAINIARRALYRKDDWKEKGGSSAFHRSFANEACFQAKIDFRQGAVTCPVSGAVREARVIQLDFWSLSKLPTGSFG